MSAHQRPVAVDAEDLRTVLSQREPHAHRAPGYWDADGTACRECAARTRLKEALHAPLPEVGPELADARAYAEELREALRATGEERDRLAAARDRLAGDVQEADTRLSEAIQAKQRAEAERDDARERLRVALDACTELSMALAAHGIKLRRADKAHTMLAAELSSARQELETHRCDTAAHSDVQTDTQEITDDRT